MATHITQIDDSEHRTTILRVEGEIMLDDALLLERIASDIQTELDTSVTIDEAAAAFEAEVDSIIQLAESELRLVRLAAEIQRTSRRVNALEHVFIPRLVAERDYIQMALDERERADRFRLKRVAQARQHKK